MSQIYRDGDVPTTSADPTVLFRRYHQQQLQYQHQQQHQQYMMQALNNKSLQMQQQDHQMRIANQHLTNQLSQDPLQVNKQAQYVQQLQEQRMQARRAEFAQLRMQQGSISANYNSPNRTYISQFPIDHQRIDPSFQNQFNPGNQGNQTLQNPNELMHRTFSNAFENVQQLNSASPNKIRPIFNDRNRSQPPN
jgi:hypothetical protein